MLKRIIIILVTVVIMSSSFGIYQVTADGTVPVEKYDALVRENEGLRAAVKMAWDWAKGAQRANFEKMQDQLLGASGQDRYSVQPVFLVPSDVSVPEDEIRMDILSALTALKDDQLWYLREVGDSFSIKRPVIITSKQPLGALERFPGSTDWQNIWNYQYPSVLSELESAGFVRRTKNVYYLVFLYGKTSINWAGWRSDYGVEMVVMDDVVRHHLSGSEGERRHARGMITHELSHVFGHLPDVELNKKTIMSLYPNGDVAFAHQFPEVHFTPQERGTLRSMMASEVN